MMKLIAKHGCTRNAIRRTFTTSNDNSILVAMDPQNGIRTITINRPLRYNAINQEIFQDLPLALEEAGKDWPRTRITVLRGSTRSPYFSSGNDLTDFLEMFNKSEDVKNLTEQMSRTLANFVASFIDFGPGLLIAGVHGPAAGISVTTLPLCDGVFASDAALFLTPFARLSQSPEGCSTFTFPEIMGPLKAMDVLAFGSNLTARDAKNCGLVTEVFPSLTFENELRRKLLKIASFPKLGMKVTRNSARFGTDKKEQLHRRNELECKLLVQRWQSEECREALKNFAERKPMK